MTQQVWYSSQHECATLLQYQTSAMQSMHASTQDLQGCLLRRSKACAHPHCGLSFCTIVVLHKLLCIDAGRQDYTQQLDLSLRTLQHAQHLHRLVQQQEYAQFSQLLLQIPSPGRCSRQ